MISNGMRVHESAGVTLAPNKNSVVRSRHNLPLEREENLNPKNARTLGLFRVGAIFHNGLPMFLESSST